MPRITSEVTITVAHSSKGIFLIMKLLAAWHDSLRYFFSAHAWRVMGRGLRSALPVAAVALALLGSLVASIKFSIPVLSHGAQILFSVQPPFIAIVSSPLYVFPLVCLHDKTQKNHLWVPYIVSGALFYFSAGALALLLRMVYLHGSAWLLAALTVVTIVALPFLIDLLWISPLLMTAYLYEPTAQLSQKHIWQHARHMAWHELPFIFLLLVAMAPIGAVVYGTPGLLVTYQVIGAQWNKPLLHIGSVLYWLCGWSVFIVYYQDRKQRYLKT